MQAEEMEELNNTGRALEKMSNSSRLDIAKEVATKVVAPVAWIIICELLIMSMLMDVLTRFLVVVV